MYSDRSEDLDGVKNTVYGGVLRVDEDSSKPCVLMAQVLRENIIKLTRNFEQHSKAESLNELFQNLKSG